MSAPYLSNLSMMTSRSGEVSMGLKANKNLNERPYRDSFDPLARTRERAETAWREGCARWTIRCVAVLIALFATTPARAAVDDYLGEIKPLLLEKCVSCHGPVREEAGLRLDTAASLRRGGDSGPAAVAGEPDESYLIARVSAAEAYERMPPEDEGEPLSVEQIELLQQWIAEGLPAPEDEKALPSPEDHWAYQPIRRPPLPDGDDAGSMNAVDRFLAAARRDQGLAATGPADAATLLRRVTLDLIGLPPRPEELAKFSLDPSPDAYRRVVDDLLASPHYGERWGRHWMDVWRYSDWDGYKNELRGSQRHIWRWRDWIVDSLNADKGYDQMILEMIAGDELAPQDPAVVRATGFLARNYHKSNRDIWLDATVEHTAKAFLAMTIACARCHDHKYDPLEQREYYAFRAIFEPHQVRTDRVAGEADLLRDGLPRAYDADPQAMTYLYQRGNEKLPDKEHPLAPAVPAVLGRSLDIEPVPLPIEAFFPAAVPHVEQEDLAAADRRVDAAQRRLAELETDADPNLDSDADELQLAELTLAAAEAERTSLAARWAADRAKHSHRAADNEGPADQRLADEAHSLATEAAAAERHARLKQAELEVAAKERAASDAEQSEETDAAKRQKAIDEATKKLEMAREKLAKARAETGGSPQESQTQEETGYTPVGEVYPATSTGRRLALAKWIASPDNPLTARVAVNHIWLRHFGAPLVENVFDFGLQTPHGEHGELLDWLAAELIDNDWSMKHIHRLIVTSDAYRAASHGDDSPELDRAAMVDPDNRLFWRANVRRLEAEVVRDSVFYVAGSLDTTLGGPEIAASEGDSVPRRSIYFQHAYEKQMTMLTIFDAASPNECYRRSESVIPQQALALANSSASLAQSRKLAQQLWNPSDSTDPQGDFIRAAFMRVLQRPPSDEERQMCGEFLDQQQRLLADPERLTASLGKAQPEQTPSPDPAMRARENLVHVLFNHNDFVTVR